MRFFVLGFLPDVRKEFTDNVSETTVSPIFTGLFTDYMTSKDGTHGWLWNVLTKPALYIVQKPKNV